MNGSIYSTIFYVTIKSRLFESSPIMMNRITFDKTTEHLFCIYRITIYCHKKAQKD